MLAFQHHFLARFVEINLAAAAMFGGITGDIRLRQQFAAIAAGSIDMGDACAGADVINFPFPKKRVLADMANQLLRQGFGLFPLAVEQDQAKFIAAEPGQAIAVAQVMFHQLGDIPQQRVACGMAGTVIDRLEAVEIEEDQRMLLLFTGTGDGGFQALLKAGAVWQAGQRVVRGAVTQFPHQFAGGGDVLQYHHCAHHFAVHRFQRRYRLLNVEIAPITAVQHQGIIRREQSVFL
ncbi:hypothetical protein D3C79_328330 [compost metagenome]